MITQGIGIDTDTPIPGSPFGPPVREKDGPAGEELRLYDLDGDEYSAGDGVRIGTPEMDDGEPVENRSSDGVGRGGLYFANVLGSLELFDAQNALG